MQMNHVSLAGLSADYPAGGGLFPPHAAAGQLFPHRHERYGCQRQDLPPAGPAGTQTEGYRELPDAATMRYVPVCGFPTRPDREILHGVDLQFHQGSFTALVGESGCGKSTIAAILMGRNKGYTGSVAIGGVELKDINEELPAAKYHLYRPSELSVQGHGAGQPAHGQAVRIRG